ASVKATSTGRLSDGWRDRASEFLVKCACDRDGYASTPVPQSRCNGRARKRAFGGALRGYFLPSRKDRYPPTGTWCEVQSHRLSARHPSPREAVTGEVLSPGRVR